MFNIEQMYNISAQQRNLAISSERLTAPTARVSEGSPQPFVPDGGSMTAGRRPRSPHLPCLSTSLNFYKISYSLLT